MRYGRPEHAQRGVADELVQRPAKCLDLPLQACVEWPERGFDVLRIRAIGPGGEADEVAEEDGDQLPFLTREGRTVPQRSPAVAAELESLGVFLTRTLDRLAR